MGAGNQDGDLHVQTWKFRWSDTSAATCFPFLLGMQLFGAQVSSGKGR